MWGCEIWLLKGMREHASAPKSNTELLLVGSWNAAKKIPEWQGKKVLRLYDKLRFPKYAKEQQKIADKTHQFLQKHQKEIGVGLTSIEGALVTFGIVKGFLYLKRVRLPARSVPAVAPTKIVAAPVESKTSVVEKVLHTIITRVGKLDKEPIAIITPALRHELEGNPFSADLRQKIASEYFGKLLSDAAGDPSFVARVNKAPYLMAKKDEVRMKMIEAAGSFLAEQMASSPSYRSMPLEEALKDGTIQDVSTYLRGLRDWFLAANCPGLDAMGIQIK